MSWLWQPLEAAQQLADAGGVTGTGAVTLPAATVPGSGGGTITRTGTITTQDPTVSGDGWASATGTGAVTTPAATVTGSGEETFTGTGAVDLAAATVAGDGWTTVTGTGAVTTEAATVSGSGDIAGLAFDAASSLVVGTGDRTFEHNPVGTPRGVLVIVVHEVGTDTVAGVTYGGAALVEVPLSPLLHTTPETGSVHAFFLGASVPTADPATWAVDVTDTSDYIAACFTVTAAMDTEVHDPSTFDSGATTAPSAPLTITKNSFVAGGLYSGLAAPGSTEVAGTAEVVTGDLGADSGEIS